MIPRNPFHRLLVTLLVTLGTSALAVGCVHDDGPLEETGEAIEDAMDDAGDSIEEAGDEAEDALD